MLVKVLGDEVVAVDAIDEGRSSASVSQAGPPGSKLSVVISRAAIATFEGFMSTTVLAFR